MTRIVLVFVCVACSASESERISNAAQRQRQRDSVVAGEVVQSAQTPTTTGRLVYEPPPNLSYDSMRVKRPDLVSPSRRPQ